MGTMAQLIGGSLIVGLVAGFVMHRADFCLVCPFRDLFMFRNAYMLRVYALLAVSSMLLFEAGRVLGLLPFYPFPLLGVPSAAHVVGGALFGVGMVLAGGCVVGTLYKIGAGRLLSLIAFAGMIAGSALYAEFHPSWASFAKSTTILGGKATLPQWAGVSPAVFVWAGAAAAVPLFLKWRREGKWSRPAFASGYLQPWAAALLLALLGTLSWATVGMPIGVTTSYAKLAGYLESLVAREHFEALAYFKAVPLSVTLPGNDVPLTGGPGPVLDAIAAIQIPLIGGIVLGSAASALSVGEFEVRWNLPAAQVALALFGGALMGLASRMAFGCNIWHLLGGIPIFALPSLLFLAGLLPGTWLGGRILAKTIHSGA